MLQNRSVPANTILPHLFYADVAAAVAWLARTFGFVEHYRHGEPGQPPSGAQIQLGDAWVMLGSVRSGRCSPAQAGCQTQCLTVFVEDVDAHFERSKAAGARIVEELHETCYGERQYGAVDLEGHLWLFARHERDVNPESWGATPAS